MATHVFKKLPYRIKLENAFRKAMSRNKKVTLLTAEQVINWWNINPKEIKKIPVAAVFDGKSYYTEYQVDVYVGSSEDAVAYGVLDRLKTKWVKS